MRLSGPLRPVATALSVAARPAGAIRSAARPASVVNAATRSASLLTAATRPASLLTAATRPASLLTAARPASLLTAASRIGAAAAAAADVGPSRSRRRVWSRGGRAHIEVRGMTGRGAAFQRLARDTTAALTDLKGVSWAEVNAVTSLVLVVFDEDQVSPDDLVDAVEAVEAAHGTGDGDFTWSQGPHPGDDGPIASAGTALAADCLGIAFAVTGRLVRFAAPPPALRAPVALIDAQPRLRKALGRYLGPVGADLAIGLANAVSHGLTGGGAALGVDAVHRLLRLGELQAYRAVWERREGDMNPPGYRLPAERPEPRERPRPLPGGPVEDAADKITVGSLLAAGGVLAWIRDPGRAADLILATVPKAARLGREGFASVLGRDLADRGVVPLDANALRRLDRVSAIVIDSAVLCAARPQVLSAASTSRSLSGAEVWQHAEHVLRGRDAADLRGRGPWGRGHWKLRRPPATRSAGRAGRAALRGLDGAEALALELIGPGGRRCGTARVGLELDPLADPVLGAARAAADQVLLTEHDSVADVVPGADAVLPASLPLADHVRRLQGGGDVVLTVSASDDEALAASDVGIGVMSGSRGACWSADLICGPGLDEAWRILAAVAAARRASERSARLSAGGTALGGLLVAARTRPRSRGGLAPVYGAAFAALMSGAAGARSVARLAAPPPLPHGNWHAMTAGDAFTRLREARPQAAGRTDRAGPPGVSSRPAGSRATAATRAALSLRDALEFARLVREELNDPLTPVLALGAVASAVVGSGVDAVLVFSVVAGNSLIGAAQRMRAEHALRRLLAGEEVLARRVTATGGGDAAGGAQEAVDGAPAGGNGSGRFAGLAAAPAESVRAGDLTAGDVIRLRPSDVVPADARLLEASDLEVDESTLTGESVPVTKTPAPAPGAPLAERTCMVYEGTSVLAGTAHAVVTASGDATEAGRAASSAERAAPPAGLQARLAELTRIALPATGIGGLAVTGMGLLRGIPLRQAMASGVAIAVAAVPEGLPLVATISELAAARRLSTSGVLVRAARALEALGRVDTVCFDKTGTLTEGRIAVARLALPGAGDIAFGSAEGRRVLRLAARASPQADGGVTGRLAHATDRAVVEAARAHAGPDPSWRLVDELPFETSRGYAASLGGEPGRSSLAVKGAPEVVLARCTSVATRPAQPVRTAGAGRTQPGSAAGTRPEPAVLTEAAVALTPARRRRAQALVQDLAARGLRVLAVAEADRPDLLGEYRSGGGQVADMVTGLTLAGFVAFADTSRPSAAEAVGRLGEAGVRTVMITGDHPATAAAIAEQIGIPGAGRVLSGPEMDKLSEDASAERISASTVFARVSPERKVHIIRSLQRTGHVVAMTGDGTNDAAAIRVADVGIGVSARGSTSARSSADLVLTDPDPTRIADALLEGRALWASARNAVSILLGGNAGEVAFMLLGTALTGRGPLNTRQLLVVNLLTDMLPALAVAVAPVRSAGGDGSSPGGPGGPVVSFMGNGLLREAGIRGGATALGALAAWQPGRMTGRRARADTMGLAGIVLTELGQTLLTNWRSPLVIATCAISAGVLAAIVQTPGVSQFFGCVPLGPAAWAIATAAAAAATLAATIAPGLVARIAPAGGAGDFPA